MFRKIINFLCKKSNNSSNCIEIRGLSGFPIYFYRDLDKYLKEVINYIDNHNIPEQYCFSVKSTLKNCLKIKGEYVSDEELDKYLNKEIAFKEMKNTFGEIITITF